MVDVRNRDEFVAWLEGRTPEERALIAGRAAWRVVPALLSSRDTETIVLPLYRGSVSTLVAGAYPTSAYGADAAAGAAARAARAARAADAAAGEPPAVFIAARAAGAAAGVADATARAADAARAAYAAADAAYAAYAAARAALTTLAAYAAADAAYAALESDVNILDGSGSVADLSTRPLWPEGEPQELARLRAETASTLLARDEHWDVWLDWIEAMHRGGRRFQDAAFAKAIDTLDLWNGTPAEVNLRIKQLVEEERARQQPPEPPEIPPQKPATIMPVWEDGRLIWRDDPAAADLAPADFDEAFAALRTDLLDLAEAAGDENIDRRLPPFLRRLADMAPNSNAPQSALFRFGHRYPALVRYGETVNAEASPLFAASFHAVVLAMDGALRQVPVWRAFEANRLKDTLQPSDREKIAELGRITAEELRSEEAKTFVGQNIPAAIEEMAKEQAPPPEDAHPERNEELEAGSDALAYDLLVSVGNVLKRMAEMALAASKAVGGMLKEAGEKAWKEFRKEIIAQAGKAGKAAAQWLFKWGKRLAILGVSVGVTSPLWGWIATKMPWLPTLIELLKPLLDKLH